MYMDIIQLKCKGEEMMKKFKKVISTIMLAIMFAAIGSTVSFFNETNVVSASVGNYPVQKVNIVGRSGGYIQYNSSKELVLGEEDANNNCEWQFVYVDDNVFKITASNGQVITPSNLEVSEGVTCNLQKDTSSNSQNWVIEGQDKDVLGNYLTYKITNYVDKTLALTYSEDGTLKLAKYSNEDNGKWLLNSAGLQGFAGYSLDMEGNEKASNIGGLLGKTVYVDNLEDFMKYSAGDIATTIVITKDISVDVPENYQHLDSDEKLLTKIKVGKNKTIIGSYGVSLNNIYFYLDKYSDSGNFIIKNLTLKHDETLDLNNFIPMYISQGENFWIDHCTFAGHDSYASENGTLQEIHQKGIDENNHVLNNYVEDAHLAFTLYTRATVYSESNYFTGVKGILDDKLCAGFTDVGSYPSLKAKVSPASTWNPSENYSYKTLSAEETKEYCTNYSGAQSSEKTFKYVKNLFYSDDTVIEEPSNEVKEPVIHNFTIDEKNSSFFKINGALSSSKGKVEYNGLTLTQCLKLDSAASIEFTTIEPARCNLVFNSNFSGQVLIDGIKYKAENGVVSVELNPGNHTIKKSNTGNLYYIGLYY